jgi:glyoxylase-like metal-dependent hydrolase (beta-lactamase superfamily II)
MHPKLEILTFSGNRWKQNCYIVKLPENLDCIVIDPGYGEENIAGVISNLGLVVVAILATHGHFDHIASVTYLQQTFGNPPFLIHQEDTSTLRTAGAFCLAFRLKAIQVPSPNGFVSDGEALRYAGIELTVMHTPGHTPGSCVFYNNDVMFSGDLLIPAPHELERLPGFDGPALVASRRRIFEQFESRITDYPGHGAKRSLGRVNSLMNHPLDS